MTDFLKVCKTYRLKGGPPPLGGPPGLALLTGGPLLSDGAGLRLPALKPSLSLLLSSLGGGPLGLGGPLGGPLDGLEIFEVSLEEPKICRL